MRLGFHVSVEGGFAQAAARARATHCETVQVFSRSPRMWRAAPIDGDDAAAFREGMSMQAVTPVMVHTPYLLNLGSSERSLGERSARVLGEEMHRGAVLGAQYVVTHLGGALEARSRVLRRIARRVDGAVRDSPTEVMLLLENSTGAGSLVGAPFAELAAIIAECRCPDRLGVCLDTAHCFAAGYEIRTSEGLEQTLADFDATVGLRLLRVLHGNDTKSELGSHLDRHWHIGRGGIGLDGFRNILCHPKLQSLPLIMETPKRTIYDDRRNMGVMNRLREECQSESTGS